MTVTNQQLQEWLNAKEDEHLEFKEAKANFHFDKLVKYCAALANEGGGSIILGVTDKPPRRVVGSTAFAELERTKAGLIDRLRLRIEAEEIAHPDGRVLVFTAPSRPIGVPVAVEGAYWMRAGEDLAPMTPDMLRRIFDEAVPDYSAEICRNATLADLDPAAIESLRSRWARHSGNKALAKRPADKLLRDAELILPNGVTYAALDSARHPCRAWPLPGPGGSDLRVSLDGPARPSQSARRVPSGLLFVLRPSLGTGKSAE